MRANCIICQLLCECVLDAACSYDFSDRVLAECVLAAAACSYDVCDRVLAGGLMYDIDYIDYLLSSRCMMYVDWLSCAS